MKKIIKKFLDKKDYCIKHKNRIPFGVDWIQDITCLNKNQDLEIVVDVGANIGQTALLVNKNFSSCAIYSFEPVPSTFQKLLDNTKPFSNIIAINSALGNSLGKLPMMALPNSEQNSLKFSNYDLKERNGNIVDVQLELLDQFCSKNNIDHINLLKIDTEGYELEVLEGSINLLSSNKVDYILLECEFLKRQSEPHGNFMELLTFLHQFNYNVVAFYTHGVDNYGWKWGDVLFKKIFFDDPGLLVKFPLK